MSAKSGLDRAGGVGIDRELGPDGSGAAPPWTESRSRLT